MDEQYNVLLFGEAGAGKSTFISACEYYLKYSTLSEAVESKHICCRTPVKLTWQDKDYTNRLTESFSDMDKNPNHTLKVYNFVYQGKSFNFINTPSFGDTRGCIADTNNAKKIVEFLGDGFRDLHAICIILKSAPDRQDLSFKYNIHQMLSLLHKDILLENIILVFTHSSGSNFGSGGAYNTFREVWSDVLNDNTFFIDNKCFTYLLAVNLKIDCSDSDNVYSDCWSETTTRCLGIFQRIQALKPQSVDKITQVSVLRATLEDLFHQQLPQLKANIHQHQTQLQEIDTIIEESRECIKWITPILHKNKKNVHVQEGHFYYLICQNCNCEKRDIYGENGKACSVNCSAWVKSWDSIFGLSNKCETCGCFNFEHDSVYKPFLEEKEKCKVQLIVSLFEKANHNVVVATQREEEVLNLFDKDTKELDQIQSDIKNYVDLLRECCFIPYSKECIEKLNMEMKIKGSTKELKNYLKEYEQLYYICMLKHYFLLG